MKRAIVVFSKSPELGEVKTRMRPWLNDSQCLSLHLALLQDTLAKCKTIDAETILYLSKSTSLPFQPCVRVAVQNGRDLGDRMRNAFAETLAGCQHVAIVGIDSPAFPPQMLLEAFDGLNSHEIVLGPAEDGGYYLIALKRMIPEIFSGIPWGSEGVLKATMDLLANRKVLLLPPCFDVDQPADLIRLRKEVIANPAPYLRHTRNWMNRQDARFHNSSAR